jgi:hypothetical protein
MFVNPPVKVNIRYKFMKILTNIYSFISSFVKKLLGLLEFFLFLRLLLKFLGANPQTMIVSQIYKYSNVFVSPFDFIFHDIYWPQGHIIEVSSITAMIGYALAVFIIFSLLQTFSED